VRPITPPARRLVAPAGGHPRAGTEIVTSHPTPCGARRDAAQPVLTTRRPGREALQFVAECLTVRRGRALGLQLSAALAWVRSSSARPRSAFARRSSSRQPDGDLFLGAAERAASSLRSVSLTSPATRRAGSALRTTVSPAPEASVAAWFCWASSLVRALGGLLVRFPAARRGESRLLESSLRRSRSRSSSSHRLLDRHLCDGPRSCLRHRRSSIVVVLRCGQCGPEVRCSGGRHFRLRLPAAGPRLTVPAPRVRPCCGGDRC